MNQEQIKVRDLSEDPPADLHGVSMCYLQPLLVYIKGPALVVMVPACHFFQSVVAC